MPAQTITSYLETLLRVLDEFKPRYILEFGSGHSTGYFATYSSVERVETVEHDFSFFKEMQGRCYDNVDIFHIPDFELYACHKPRFSPDLAFIDGRNRVKCLRECRLLSPIVMLHDADRGKYREGIDLYKFKIWTDDGNTVTLCNDEEIYTRLSEILK